MKMIQHTQQILRVALALSGLAGAIALAAPASEKVAWIGVMVAPVDDTLRNQLKLPRGVGLAVQEVVDDSPAARAGLQAHDILEQVDDQLLFNSAQFRSLVRTHEPGDTVTVSLRREGERLEREIVLGETEATEIEDLEVSIPHLRFSPDGSLFELDDGKGALKLWRIDPKAPREFEEIFTWPGLKDRGRLKPTAFLGVELDPVDPSLAAQLNLGDDPGVLVRRVVEDTPAAKAGLKEHDLILEMDDEPVANAKAFAAAIREHQAGDKIRLTLLRAGARTEIEVTLEERQMPEVEDLEMMLQRLQPKIKIPKIEIPKVMPQAPGSSRRRVIIRQEERDTASGGQTHGDTVVVTQTHAASEPAHIETQSEVQITRDADREQTHRTIVIRSDTGVITLEEKDGHRHVTAKDPDGKTLFDGPVNTAEEIANLPPDVRKRLEQLDRAERKLPPAPPIEKLELKAPPRAPDLVRWTGAARVV